MKCHFNTEKECIILVHDSNMCVACQMHERNKIERHGDELQERLIKTQEALTKAVTPEAYQGGKQVQSGDAGYK